MKTDISALRSRLGPMNLAFMGLTLFFASVAVNELQITARFSDLFYLKATLTEEDSANRVIIDKYATQADAVVTTRECRPDVLDGGLAFVLRDIDLQNPIDQYDAWAAAMTSADRYVTHALSCNPGSGDLWARLAMLRQAASENAEELSTLMKRSALLAPSEMYVLRARFFVWKKATTATLDRASDVVDHDIRTLLNYADPPDIAVVLSDSGANLRPHILAAMKFVPAERLSLLRALHIDPAKF